jgi:hypothetical protein
MAGPSDRALGRLSTDQDLLPWRRAEQLTACALYWLPVRSFPIPVVQRSWVLEFVNALSLLLAKKPGLRCETFLQMSAIYPELLKEFQARAMDAVPLIGLSWSPSGAIPPPPEKEVEDLQNKRKSFSFGEHVESYCYWFLKKSDEYRNLFFGHGGTTLLFLAPDPKTEPPPVAIPSFIRDHPFFKSANLDGLLKSFASLQDDFVGKSKELFGGNLESRPEAKGTLYVLPRFTSRDFFEAQADAVKKWFELFGVYFSESPSDHGILLAVKDDFDAQLTQLVRELSDRGLSYPEL